MSPHYRCDVEHWESMTDLIKTEVRETTGVITLDRPKALNSLNHEMARAIDATLKQWRNDDAIAQVVVQSAG